MPYLRQSTAQTVRFGPFLDVTDGVTEEVALTITPALRRLSKDGAAFAAASGAVNATHDSDGWYSASLTTTDTNTVGELILNVQVPATHLPVWMRWWVLEEAVYDAMYGAAAAGPLQPTVAARTLDVATTGEAGLDLGNTIGTLDAAQIGANAFTAAKFAASSLNGKGDWNIGKTGYSLTVAPPTAAVNADAVWDEAQADHAAALSFGEIATEIAAIPTTAMRGTDGVDTAAMRGTDGALTDKAGFSLSTAGILAIWHQLESTIVTAATIGLKIKNNLDAVLSARTLLAANYFDPAADTVANVTTVGTTTTNTDMRGTDLAYKAPIKNAAFSDLEFFMALATDHVTAATGLTVGVTRSIDGAAFAAGTGTVAEVANGIYQYDASAADMNGNMIVFRFTGTAADDTFLGVRTNQ